MCIRDRDPEAGQDVSEAKYARFGGNDSDDLNKNFRPASNVFTTKGDYLCLRDVTLSYVLSNSALKKAMIENITFTPVSYTHLTLPTIYSV